MADPSTTEGNPIVSFSKTEDRVRSPSLLMENVLIVARKATEKLTAGKGRMMLGEQEGAIRTSDDKPEKGSSLERRMDKSGTAQSKKKEWQNGRRLILLIKRAGERVQEISVRIQFKELLK